MRFQIGTSNERGGRRYNPYVFTEQGVAMLSSVLHTNNAIKTSIQIINVFVAMYKYISSNLFGLGRSQINYEKSKKELMLLKIHLQNLKKSKKINEVYFRGQIYDAYSKIQEIFKEAKRKLVIVYSKIFNLQFTYCKRTNVMVYLIY